MKKFVPILSTAFIVFSCYYAEALDDDQVKDLISRLDSLHSTLQKSISEHDEKTKELKNEQNSIRQKLNVQASHVRRLQDAAPAWAKDFKQDILSAISAATAEVDPNANPKESKKARRSAINNSIQRKIADSRRQKEDDDEEDESREAGPPEVMNRYGPRPSYEPGPRPSYEPGPRPSYEPGPMPSYEPGPMPSYEPGPMPSYEPGPRPSYEPGPMPSHEPGPRPSYEPGPRPSYEPGPMPSYEPGPRPSYEPGPMPSYEPGPRPSFEPGPRPSYEPGPEPSYEPSAEPEGQDDDEVMEKLEREIHRREKLKQRVKTMENDFFDLKIDMAEMKMQLNATKKMINKTMNSMSGKQHSSSKMRCESGVKSSGELVSNEAKMHAVNFTKPFANTPHVLVAASMAAKYEMEDGTQVPSGPVDFHLRKRRVSPHNFTIEFTTSSDDDAFIFASWMACGNSF